MTHNTNNNDHTPLYIGGMGYTQSGAKVHRLYFLGENARGAPMLCLASHGGGASATWHKVVDDYSEVNCGTCLKRIPK